MNLNNNEREIPEDQLEEYVLKLNANDFACRSKARRRDAAGSSPIIVPLGEGIGLTSNQGNILSPIMKYRRK